MLDDYQQIVRTVTNTPWLMAEDSLAIVVKIINMRLSGQAYTDAEIRTRLEDVKKNNGDRKNPRIEIGGGVGILPLYGSIFPKANLMTELSGATSLETFAADLRELAANDDVKQIVMDIDSPGGASSMVPETGRIIKEVAAVKPVIGMSNVTAGSAALWLLSQCKEAYCTESGKVGSLGVYFVHEDHSEQNAKLGVKTTYISAGDFKTAGNPDEPLSSDARQYIQESVDETYQEFLEVVASGRSKTVDYVKENFGQGRMLSAKKAANVGMIDGVMSMNDLLGSLVEKNMATTTSHARTTLAHNVSLMKRALRGGTLLEDSIGASEPGDVRPHPELNKDESADKGWRRDTPPPGEDGTVPSRSDTVTGQHLKGGDVMNEELLKQLMSSLGITASGDTAKDEAAITAAVNSLNAEVQPIRELKAKSEQRQQFAEMYPAEAKRLADLEARDRETTTKAFSASFANARVMRTAAAEGSTPQPTNLGFSGSVVNEIQTFATALTDGNANLEGFKGVLDSIMANGIVDYGTEGSDRPEDAGADDYVPNNSLDARQAFFNAVEAIRTQDKLDFEAALSIAAEKHPKLYAAYMQPPVVA
jgi:signal peptide peptidase SppA